MMEWISKSNILVVGLGLIGGSYAKGLKRLGFHVEAIDTREEAIRYALENDIIDDGCNFVDPERIAKADAVIFGLYPGVFLNWIKKHQHLFHPGTLITDVTGVKSCIVYEIQNALRDDVEFIPAHPMAGKEVYGVENSDHRIFLNANFIVTPTEKNTQAAIDWCCGLGKILGFRRISILTPEEHDQMIGFVSQLTHVIAVALMTCNDNTHLVDYTGDSFRDLTRIARINDAMWSELFIRNKDSLLHDMDTFMEELSTLRNMLVDEDVEGLREKMRLSTHRRALFDK